MKFSMELDPAKVPPGRKRAFELNLELIESQIKKVFNDYFEKEATNSSTGLCTVIDTEVPCSEIVIRAVTGKFFLIFDF